MIKFKNVAKTKSVKSVQSFKTKNTSCVLSHNAQRDTRGGCCENPPPKCGEENAPAC